MPTSRSDRSEPAVTRLALKLSPAANAKAQADPNAVFAALLEDERTSVPVDARVSAAPLFDAVSPDQLRELQKRAAELDPTYEPVDLGAWWQIGFVDPRGEGLSLDETVVDDLVRRMPLHRAVESAHVLRPGEPPVNAVDDPRSTNQGYLDAAPTGIDARYAWTVTGGDGAGIGFVDVEQGWNLSHEDLTAAGITLISGTNAAYFYHGTSVLGEIRMVDNTLGGVGIAPASVGRVISQHQPSGYNTPGAILGAAAVMSFGDVMLLEAQEYDPVGGLYFWPVEIADATYDAIRLATALGIVVVEAACNGGYDLDAYTNLAGKHIFDRSSADFRDSGAVMVGAAQSSGSHPRSGFSNFGSRVDCYGWGDTIDTTSTNAAGTDNTLYTGSFGGTSGASPMVVGAALIIQGIAVQALGYRFAPLTVRRLLKLHGTPSATPATDLVGVMPNLRGILDGSDLNLAPDLYVRDYPGDLGDPTSGGVSSSPDIIVLQAPVADPMASYGEGSGTENSSGLSQDVVSGSDHSVYVRLRNRGGSAATGVSVDVYWSPPSTLVTPNLWNLIGTTTVANVPTGNLLTVSDEITWPAASVPAPGHYCFVAIAGNTEDPKPGPAAFSTWANYVTFVQNNNNVAWRNFNVIPAPPNADVHELSFMVPGAFDASREFAIEAIGNLPRGSRVQLQMPLALAKALRVEGQGGETVEGEELRIPLHPFGRTLVGAGVIPAKWVAKCQLLVEVPETAYRRGRWTFALRQLSEKTEMGRITWAFGQVD